VAVGDDIGLARPRSLSRRRALIAGLVIAAAVLFLIVRGLGNATVYFKTADEAVAQKAKLGSHRFRVEGTVLGGTVHQAGRFVDFRIASNNVAVDVVHDGDPPELFKAGIPVVLEGRWSGDHFASDRIMVKHSETYRQKNPQRVQDYPK
jgi:cytochrome c-type biogenesis protein CcmE